MFAPPYSPNKKFSNSKIFPPNLKKSPPLPGKHCMRCQMKSSDSKYFSNKSKKLNSFSVTASHKNLPNLKSLSSIHTGPNANYDKNKLKKFEPFSTFGQNDSNKFMITMKQNKTTSLSLERFNKESKSQHKISYKKVIIQSTKINKKPLVKRPGKIQYEKNKIYKLYESLKQNYQNLKVDYDEKLQFFQKHEKQSSIIFEKRNSQIKKLKNQGQSVEQSYQIKTQWAVKVKGKQKDFTNSRTSIQAQECYAKDNEAQTFEKQQMRIAEIQKEKQFYRQECLGLEKQLQSVNNTVMELKRQIQVLNQKSESKHQEIVSVSCQNYQLHNQTPIRNPEFYRESSVKQSLLQQDLYSDNYASSNYQSPISILNAVSSQMSHFPTQESIQSPSIILEDIKNQDENLFRNLPQSQKIEEQSVENKEEKEGKKSNVKKIWRRVICDSNTNNVIEEGSAIMENNVIEKGSLLTDKNESKVSGTTWIGSSGISEVTSLKFDAKNLSQNVIYEKNNSKIKSSLQNEIKCYKSEVVIKAPDYIEAKPQISTVSVNRYHSYCKKNCDMNQCRCLLDMMTVYSSSKIHQNSSN